MEDNNRSRHEMDFSSSNGSSAAIQIHDLVRALYRHRWAMVGVFLLVVVAATAYVMTSPPVYEARTQLMIEPENPKLAAFDEGTQRERDLTPYYQTQYAILKSRTLARRTIDELKLWNDPEFSSRPDASTYDDVTTKTINAFLSRLSISYKVNSRLVDIVFEARDPELAAKVANTMARIYATQNVELRVNPFEETADLFNVRLEEQRRRVEESELALQQYLDKNDVATADSRQSIVTQKLTAATAALTEATAERMRRQVRYEQLEAVKGNAAALEATPLIVGSTVVQSLKSELAAMQLKLAELSQRYGELHPEVVRTLTGIETTKARLTSEIATMVESARNDYRAGVDREQRLESQIENLRAAELAEQRAGISYRALERDAATNRAILETLLKRAKETKISGELTPTSVQVVDVAEIPLSPVRPQTRVILVLAAVFGALSSLGFAFALEFGRDRIRSVDEIRTGLGLRSLGMVPLEATAPSADNHASQQFSESIRTVRSNVMSLVAKDAMPSSVLVTSSNVGEGKTTVACSLAAALADVTRLAEANGTGMVPRVLIVDADLRAPRVHTFLGVPQGPGLAELIDGEVPLVDAVRPCKIPGLCVLPAGKAKANAADVLGSPAFKKALRSVNQLFDIVVIDSPPVLAVSDASVIAREGLPVLMVIGADKTGIRSARAALDQMEGPETRILGAVLNRVTLQQHPYYYSPYYRKEHQEYYGHSHNGNGHAR
jgi:capsular exopolysaccharide synthesis family protein